MMRYAMAVHAEDAYFLFTVRIHDASLARSNTNPKKVYCIDHALVTSTASGSLVDSGRLLEDLVFTTLRRVHPEVFYYKTGIGREVDFIVPVRGRPKLLVQACESLAGPQTRKRERASLEDAMAELSLKEAIIVARNAADAVETDRGTVRIVPAWRFLLDIPDQGG